MLPFWKVYSRPVRVVMLRGAQVSHPVMYEGKSILVGWSPDTQSVIRVHQVYISVLEDPVVGKQRWGQCGKYFRDAKRSDFP